MFLTCVKYFFILINCCLVYCKTLPIPLKKSDYGKHLFLALLGTPILYASRLFCPTFTLLLLELFLICFMGFRYKRELSLNICLSTISIGIAYVSYILSAIAIVPLHFLFFFFTKYEWLLDITNIIGSSILSYLLLFLLFKTKRLRNGFPNIENSKLNDVGVFISAGIIFIVSFLMPGDYSLPYRAVLLAFILILGLTAFLWWKKYISNIYILKSQKRTNDILEEKILEQETEIERLSKLIHKDNKLISAMELSVGKLYEATENEYGKNLLTELSALSAERAEALRSYEDFGRQLPKSGIFSTDMIVDYLNQRSREKKICFEVMFNGDISYMTEKIIDKKDLNTLLADLGENAVIATADMDFKKILLSLGRKDGSFAIDFFDSGLPFDAGVIEAIGKRRHTTHKEEGGSGIGLMTTTALIKKYKASLEIEELTDHSLFTKRVSVVFDEAGAIRVSSSRPEILSACKKREDITVLSF